MVAPLYRLGDGCMIKHGFAFKGEHMSESSDADLPIVVNIGNFQYTGGFRFETTKIQRYSGEFPDQFIMAPGDVLIVMTCQTPGGEILGIPGRIPSDDRTYLHNQRMGKVVVTRPDELSLDYLYYLFLSPAMNAHLVASASGAKILHTAPDRIESFRWRRPPIHEQRRIASILAAYDDLIENNAKRIRIMEELVRSLYREWLMDFRFPGHDRTKFIKSQIGKIPEGWRSSSLGDLVDECREAVDPSDLDPETPYFGLEHLPRRSLALAQWGTASEVQSTKLRARQGDILFGKIRPYFHKVGPAPLDAVCSSDTIVLRVRNESHYGAVLGCVSSDAFVAHSSQTSQGTKMPRANWDVLKKYPCPIPPDGILQRFNATMTDAVSFLRTLVLKNRNLASSRDLLLPRLISGEIDVSSLRLETAAS